MAFPVDSLSTSSTKTISTSSNSSTLQNTDSKTLFSNPQSGPDLFLNELFAKNKIDDKGFLLESAKLPNALHLNDNSIARLNWILEQNIKTNAFNQPHDLSCKKFLCKLDLSQGRVLLVGGAVLWLLGSEGLFEAGCALLGKEKFEKIFKKETFLNFDQRKCDFDFRYCENDSNSESSPEDREPETIADKLLESIADDIPLQNTTKKSICDELRKLGGPFAAYHPFFEIEGRAIKFQAYRVNHDNGQGFELDLLISSIMGNDALLTLQDLTLDITDYLQNPSETLEFSGSSFRGFQAIVAHLGKLIQFKSLTPTAWARAESKKIHGYRTLVPYPNEIYADMKPLALRTTMQRIIKGRLNSNPISTAMYLIDCASDLIEKGFHFTFVDQILPEVSIDSTNLSKVLQAVLKAHEEIPMELILATLTLVKQQDIIKKVDGILQVVQENSTAQIQMKLNKAVEIFFAHEMLLRSSKSEKIINGLKNLCDELGCTMDWNEFPADKLIGLQLVEKNNPHLLDFACEVYLKNNEHNPEIVFQILSRLFPINFTKTTQYFLTHLKHVQIIERKHVEFFNQLATECLKDNRQNNPLQAINLILSLAQTICTKSPEHKESIIQIIETLIGNHLDKNRLERSVDLLKLSCELGIKPTNRTLWGNCLEEIFKKSANEAFQFWTFATQQGIELQRTIPDRLHMIIPFIEELYNMRTPESSHLGDDIVELLPVSKHKSGFSTRMDALKAIRERNISAQVASNKNLESMFAFLEKGSNFRGPEEKERAIAIFIDCLKAIRIHDKNTFNVNINRISRLLPEFIPICLQNPIRIQQAMHGLIQHAFQLDSRTNKVLELFQIVLMEMPLDRDLVLLFIKCIKDDRFSVASKEFMQCLQDKQSLMILQLMELKKYQDAVRLINFIGEKGGNLGADVAVYFEAYIPALTQFLENDFSTDVFSFTNKNSLTKLLAAFPYTNDKIPAKSWKKFSSLIHALIFRNMTSEAIQWINTFLKFRCWDEKNSDTVALQLFSWIESIASKSDYKESIKLIDSLCTLFPSLENKLFELMMKLSDDILPHVTENIARAIFRNVTLSAPAKEDIHTRTKINKLVWALLHKSGSATNTLDTALDFLSMGSYDDSFAVQLKILENCSSTNIKDSLRGWKFFRVRFFDYISNQEIQANDPTVLKCLRASKPILQEFCKNRDEKGREAIDRILDEYFNDENKLKQWISDPNKKKLVVKDIATLLEVRTEFLNRHHEINNDLLKKMMTFRLKLLKYGGLKKNSLIQLNLNLAKQLISTKNPELYIHGIKLLYRYALDGNEITSDVIDLFLECEKFSFIELGNFDRMKVEWLLAQIRPIFVKQEPSKQQRKKGIELMNQLELHYREEKALSRKPKPSRSIIVSKYGNNFADSIGLFFAIFFMGLVAIYLGGSAEQRRE